MSNLGLIDGKFYWAYRKEDTESEKIIVEYRKDSRSGVEWFYIAGSSQAFSCDLFVVLWDVS